MKITSSKVYSKRTGKLIDANYEPSLEAIEKVAMVALALNEVEQVNNEAVVITVDRVTIK